MAGAAPIATAPRDGTWFRAISPDGLDCRAHFVVVGGPAAFPVTALVSEAGFPIEPTHWLPE